MALSPEAKALAAFGGMFTAWKWADGQYHISHDVSTVRRFVPIIKSSEAFAKDPKSSAVLMWEKTLKAVDHKKVVLIQAETGEKYTVADVEAFSNRIANWAAAQPHLTPDCTVALVMENCIEYLPIWLGLAKAGIRIAWLNSHIKGKALVHSISIADSVAVIAGAGMCANAVNDVIPQLQERGIKSFAELRDLGTTGPLASPLFQDLRVEMGQLPKELPGNFEKVRRGHIKSSMHVFSYIYTSGTTGLPKACRIPHQKFFGYSLVMPVFACTKDDVFYGSGMPLYHSAANLGAIQAVTEGATYIVRRKFSATNHWKECTQYGATVMQYIGELCRYLLAVPDSGFEDKHKLRIAVGNGLRPEIWNEFQRRFNIPEVGEFYGATEGNAMMFNLCRNYEGQGAISRQGPLLAALKPSIIVKFDVEEEVPVRDKVTKHCVRVKDGEVGELLTPIKMLETPQGQVADFAGYTNAKETDKKVMRDVFVKGDSYFRTGDLVKEQGGYTYFVDRIGDTFRWKGENVSTMEVSEVLSTFPGIVEASVYGVQIPGKDGRGCMVALRMEDGVQLDAEKFATYCSANLPSYSVPLFIRFLTGMDTTGTFKHMKVEYKKQGFNPEAVKDVMWFFHPVDKTYLPLTQAAYQELVSGLAAKL
eukprot:TRINITY_DN465_c0_g1_i1.p1 TRINITY_DN465_c0_g1~~TRINITY_DN465_c0_g1_i1.p1  ORF type:complete len:670 (+),score=303.30 TRINITY_DN465_c0_g1_i1:71-2011(+)